MGVVHRIAHVEEAAQELAQRQRAFATITVLGLVELLDGVHQVIALDEAHGVEGPSRGIVTETVDWDDSWMFQTARDFGLHQEA